MPQQHNLLYQHRPFLKEQDKVDIAVPSLKKDSVVEFSYKGKLRHVYVLNPHYQGFLHGLSLKSISHLLLLEVMKWVPELTEHAMYEEHLNIKKIKKADAYRTYKLQQISNLKLVKYEIPKVI